MTLSLRAMRYVQAALRHGSITAAADVMHVTDGRHPTLAFASYEKRLRSRRPQKARNVHFQYGSKEVESSYRVSDTKCVFRHIGIGPGKLSNFDSSNPEHDSRG